MPQQFRPDRPYTGAGSAAVSEPPETYIVQNVTPGPHFVTDTLLRLEFGPYECKDLTWEDPAYVKGSSALKNSLRRGILRRISQDQWDDIQERELANERQEQTKAHNKRAMAQARIRAEGVDNAYDAEMVEINQASGRNGDEITSKGYVNDPQTYADYYAAAEADARAKGLTLDPAEFGRHVTSTAHLRGNVLAPPRDEFPNGVTSGGDRSRAYVAMPPRSDGDANTVASMPLRDRNDHPYLAGAREVGLDPTHQIDDNGYAEEIDLANDD